MKFTRRRFISSAFLFLSGIAISDALFFEKWFIQSNEFDLNTGIGEADKIKVVQISDLHLKSIKFFHRRLCKKINDAKPDLVCITGDAIDDGTKLIELSGSMALLDRNIPKVAILGNWEYWGKVDLKELKNLYSNYNCDLLINQHKRFFLKGRHITITGTDDYVGGKADIDQATSGFLATQYHIVLNHCPQYSEIIPHQIGSDIPVDLILSGDTHGGQVNLLGIIPFLPQGSGRFVKGWYKDRNMNLYVSKGIGTSLLPIRFGARAEMSTFNI